MKLSMSRTSLIPLGVMMLLMAPRNVMAAGQDSPTLPQQHRAPHVRPTDRNSARDRLNRLPFHQRLLQEHLGQGGKKLSAEQHRTMAEDRLTRMRQRTMPESYQRSALSTSAIDRKLYSSSTTSDTTTIEKWATLYDFPLYPGDDCANAIAIDTDGNVYVTGSSNGSGFSYDYVTIKYDASGTQQWVARYDGPANSDDWATAIAVDGNGNVYVTGGSIGPDFSYDYATIKYDASGTQQWVARYDSPANGTDFATALAIDGSGNVYVTGYSTVSAISQDYATIKYDASGTQKWVARYDGTGSYNYASAIAVDGSGNVYVTGSSVGSNTYGDYATIKYNASGTQQWVARYNGLANGNDDATAIAVDSRGYVYVTGYSTGSGTSLDYATIKYDTSGTEQWVTRYNDTANYDDEATSIAIDGGGNVYVTGYSCGDNISSKYATIKYDSLGAQQWVALYSGPGKDNEAVAITIDGGGNVYVAGWSSGSDSYFDYATIKYDGSGRQQWVARYNGTGGYNFASAIAVDGSGNVYLTGCSSDAAGGFDDVTIKYDTSGIQQWTARYGSYYPCNVAAAMTVDGSGNVYVTGYSNAGTYPDYVTVKYDASGVQQWAARYNGPADGEDEAAAITVDGSGNVYVTGYSNGIGTLDDYATIKYDAWGTQQWVVRYNGTADDNDEAVAIAVDSSGNVYVTGQSADTITGDGCVTIKYDASGAQQWLARYNGNGYATALAIDGGGNVYVTGNYATVKYDSSGVQQWVARYDGPGDHWDWSKALAVDVSGNVYVTGYSAVSGISQDYATIKFNASGTQQWVARYDGPAGSQDVATAIAVDSRGYVYVTGYSTGSGTSLDYATIKYDASGTQQWVARYNGPGNYDDYATALAIDGSGNVYVTGQSVGSDANNEYATIKYDASGTQQWVQRYSTRGSYEDDASAIAIDNNGNVYVTGTSLYGFGEVIATIAYGAAGAPQLSVHGISTSPTFTWSYSLSCNSYHLQVSKDSLFDSLVADNSAISETKYTVSGVLDSGICFGRVSTANSGNNWSNVVRFPVIPGDSLVSHTHLYTIGWNIVGIPSIQIDFHRFALFPDATSPAYSYAGKYYISDTMNLGTGYWLRFSKAKLQAIIGCAVERESISVRRGWNMISSMSVPMPVALITSDPPGLVTSRLFRFTDKYVACDTLYPAEGYWIKVSEAGRLVVASSGEALAKNTASRIQVVSTSEVPPTPPDVSEIESVVSDIPTEYALGQNYPNPFNPSTDIRYSLPANCYVSINVYDVLGREVATLVNESKRAGEYSVEWDAGSLPSGIYFYRLVAGTFTQTRKLLLIK